jgi:hypothetical protein
MGGLPQSWDPPGAPLLTPQAPGTERMFYTAPDCLALRLIDVAGNVRHLSPWCPPASTGASPGANAGAQPGSAAQSAGGAQPAATEAASCGSGPGRASGRTSFVVVVIGGVARAVARRRRFQERRQAETDPRM